MEVSKDRLIELRNDVEVLLLNAQEFKERFKKDAINWGDLHCFATRYCIDNEGEGAYMIEISECDPSCGELKRYIIESLKEKYGDNIEVYTEW